MKVRENTVVTFSYYFMSSPDEDAPSSPDRVHTMEVIIGRDMLPIEVEFALMNMDEGEEVVIPITVNKNLSQPELYFVNFKELPEGIEFEKGMKISVLSSDGSTEVMVIEDILPEGILGRSLLETDEKPKWMKVLIKSVRWATLREFQEGRVISTSRHYHGHNTF